MVAGIGQYVILRIPSSARDRVQAAPCQNSSFGLSFTGQLPLKTILSCTPLWIRADSQELSNGRESAISCPRLSTGRSGENLTSDDVLRDARAAAATVRAKPPVVVGELADSMLFVDLVPV